MEGTSLMKKYQVTVYRTVQQSATVTIESDRELNDTEIKYIRTKAEDEAGELSDYDWKNEEVDDKVDVTIYDGNEYYLT
tara:strand:- start:212 stop:448 length:237 start_codon:yes stop_codon:yes gene_type:complete